MRWRTLVTTALCSLALVAAAGPASAADRPGSRAPAPPTGLRVPTLAFDEHSITLAWQQPADHAGIVDYHVFQDGRPVGSSSTNPTSPAQPLVDRFYADPANARQVRVVDLTFTATGLQPRTRHRFTVRSVDAAGRESRDSRPVVQSTTAAPRVFDVADFGAV